MGHSKEPVQRLGGYCDWLHSDNADSPPICNAVLEAQAMKCLCIVTDAGGLSENVIDGTTGWVVPRRSANSIANSLLKIIDMSPDSLKIIRDSAAIRVKEKFNLTQQNELFRNFYTQK